MQRYDTLRILKSPTLLILSVTLTYIFIITSNAYSQTLHDKTLDEMINQPLDSKTNSKIDVGKYPVAININEDNNTIYVANSGSKSITVVDGDTNTQLEDIKIHTTPIDIAVNEQTNLIYVANSGSNTISVINRIDNAKIGKDIPVGKVPLAISINQNNNTVYVANSGSNTISVFNGTPETKIIEEISVGKKPTAIGINQITDTVYVANSGSNTISVISGKNYTKIGEDILVGTNPTAIRVNPISNKVYVLNSGSPSISVINTIDNTKVEEIPLQRWPTAIGNNIFTDSIYVTNSPSNSISVISGKNYTSLAENIPVGKKPKSIAINKETNTVYVANLGDNTISVIDGISNKVVAGITFQVYPLYSGHIECNGLKPPTSQYFYIYYGTICIAKPNKGFEFLSWEENLKNNSTQLVAVSPPAFIDIFDFISDTSDSITNFLGIQSTIYSITNFLGIQSTFDSISNLFNIQSYEPESILNITKFGSFTANFKELPSPLPPEYWATLFGVVVSALIGSWLTPTVIGWRNAKKHQDKLNNYQREIDNLEKDGKLDKNDIPNLDKLRENVIAGFTRGDIIKDQYDVLLNNISIRYNEIFKNEIISLKTRVNNDTAIKLIEELDAMLDDAYLEEKIDKEHYTLLKDKIIELKKNKNINK